MSVVAVVLSLLVGAVVGTASGLLGIGGGLLMVPFLYLLMGGAGWSGLDVPLEHQAALAHATSLAVIVPTAASGLLAFRREGVVSWNAVIPLGLAAALAALGGARVAVALPTAMLKLAFGVFALAMGMRLLRRARGGGPSAVGSGRPMRWWGAVLGGGLVGFMSALLGVGGGVVAIPILLAWGGLDLHRVVPASIGIIVFAAPAGVLAYVLAGGGLDGMPPGSLGFVHLPAALAMIPGAVLMAPVGARLNQRMGTGALRVVFGVLLVVLGVQLAWENGVGPGLGF